MKKLVVLSIMAILLLSGCTSKVDDKSDQSSVVNSSLTKTSTDANATNNVSTETEKIGVNSENSETISISGEGGWCTPESKMMSSGKEFTVVGVVSYKGQGNICKAEKVTQDGSSTIYYNEDYANNGSNQFIEAISTGKNASANASASASASASARAVAVSDPGAPGIAVSDPGVPNK